MMIFCNMTLEFQHFSLSNNNFWVIVHFEREFARFSLTCLIMYVSSWISNGLSSKRVFLLATEKYNNEQLFSDSRCFQCLIWVFNLLKFSNKIASKREYSSSSHNFSRRFYLVKKASLSVIFLFFLRSQRIVYFFPGILFWSMQVQSLPSTGK